MVCGAIWWHRSVSTLAQVMAYEVPSHYLNQCWLTISKFQWHSSEGNFTAINLLKLAWKLPIYNSIQNLSGASELTLDVFHSSAINQRPEAAARLYRKWSEGCQSSPVVQEHQLEAIRSWDWRSSVCTRCRCDCCAEWIMFWSCIPRPFWCSSVRISASCTLGICI